MGNNQFSKMKVYLVLSALFSVGAGAANITRVFDDRVRLSPTSAPVAARNLLYRGQAARLENGILAGENGKPLFNPQEKILDVRSAGDLYFFLLESRLTLQEKKKTISFGLGGHFKDGVILDANPKALHYEVTNEKETLFFRFSANRWELYFALGPEFVEAKIDKFANTVIACKHSITIINDRGGIVPLLQLNTDTITGLEVMPLDNGLLVSTKRGLLKIPFTAKALSVLGGQGQLSTSNGKYYWHDPNNEKWYEVQGLDQVGRLASDKAYAEELVAKSEKLLVLGLRSEARTKLRKALELSPQSTAVKELLRLSSQETRVEKGSQP